MRAGTLIVLGALTSGIGAAGGVAPPDAELAATGGQLYGQMCRQCHGHELHSSGAATFDLRKFPVQDKARFITSVMKGKNDMPSHDDVLLAPDLEALYAYVIAIQQTLTPAAGAE